MESGGHRRDKNGVRINCVVFADDPPTFSINIDTALEQANVLQNKQAEKVGL